MSDTTEQRVRVATNLGRGFLSGVAFVLPVCVLWAMMLPHAAPPQLTSRIPNPTKTPGMPGLGEILVYAEPWFAGTMTYWFVLGGAAGMFLIVRALSRPLPDSPSAAKLLRSISMWTLCAATMGLVFAAPWIYGLYLLMNRDR